MSEGSAQQPPATLPIQPIPLAVHIAKDRHQGGCTTALARTWRAGDTDRCRLCPDGRCKADAGVCLVQVRMDVPDGEAMLFSTVGLRWSSDGVFVRPEHAGFVDLDRVMVLDHAGKAGEEHLAEPLGRAAL